MTKQTPSRAAVWLTLVVAVLQPLLLCAASKHVVVVVWDGMRPDFVSPGLTPNLYALATNGVFFKRHHALYISTTEVNGTGIATGCHPEHSGIIANADYRPELGWLGSNPTEGLDTIRRADQATAGKYLLVPTLAEILHQAGIPTAIAGSKQVVFLHDRARLRTGEATNSVLVYAGNVLPRSAAEAVRKGTEDKDFPASAIPNRDRDQWTTKALAKALWHEGVPKFSLLWLSEPDASQHASAPGSSNALAGIEHSDKQLGEIVKVLAEKHLLDKTDFLITADHGFSTVGRQVDVLELLKRANFKAFRRFEDPERGDVLVVSLGGSICFYVFEHDEAVTRRLVALLQTTDFASVIFSRVAAPGTFPLETVRLNATNVVPDVVVSMRWSPDCNENGTPGLVVSEGSKGTGTHGSLSPFDMRPNLVASGPSFKHGVVSGVPTGNIDITPTVLYLLGVKPPVAMDGRVLHEALVGSHVPTPEPRTETLEAEAQSGLFRWRQHLKVTQVGQAVYFDEGNGAAEIR